MRKLSKIAIGWFAVLIGLASIGEAQPPCEFPPPPLTTSTLFLSWTGAGCTTASCPAGENVTLGVQTFGMDFSCATYTFDWNFGDGTSVTTSGPTTTHHYNTSGAYDVSVRIARSDSQLTLARTLVISAPIPTLSIVAIVALAL